jgi:phosphoheptose isomerase
MAATTDQLHTFAITAEKNLEQLATGIATVGADDNTIKGISQMADACRTIAVKLAQGGNAAPAHEAASPQPHPSTNDAIAAHMAQRRAAAGPPAAPGY